MFVRRKHNRSGSTSIQVIAKIGGKYSVQKSFGSSSDETVLSSLENIRDLEQGGYEYILGARIRSQSEQFKEQVASLVDHLLILIHCKHRRFISS